jgi:HEPN domain-containing protein
MITGPQLRDLARGRLKVARSLIDAGDHTLAVEMMGMALECALKACICKTLGLRHYPDFDGSKKEESHFFRSHEYARLLLLAGLQTDFELRPGNKRKYQNWSDSTTWDVSQRYSAMDTYTKEEAEVIYRGLTKSATGVITFIKDNNKW